jgi:acyl-CoA synthetase (AMP-forming)/AMP-acid ligase II
LAHISGLYFSTAYVVEGRGVAMMEKFDVGCVGRIGQQASLPLRSAGSCSHPDGAPGERSRRSVRGNPRVGSGTAPIPVELEDEFERRYRIPILTTYGASEFAGAIADWTLEDKKEWGLRKRGSVGRPRQGIDLRIVDEHSGQVLAPGVVGLLEARGAQLPTDGDGWVRTNDLASVDDDGFLFIHGRADEPINRGGFKVPPSVIEDALRDHPAVNEACVVALHDARLGQVPAVAVTLISHATEAELLEYLASQLTRYQQPIVLKGVDELPRSSSLKVSRELVRQHYFNDMHAGSG